MQDEVSDVYKDMKGSLTRLRGAPCKIHVLQYKPSITAEIRSALISSRGKGPKRRELLQDLYLVAWHKVEILLIGYLSIFGKI